MIRRYPPLPDPSRRLTPTRKAEIIDAVRAGQITRAAAMARYRATEDEFRSWELRLDAYGLRGLKVTQLQAVGR